MATDFGTRKMVKLSENDGQKGGVVQRWFTNPGIHPFDEIEWERRDARIIGAKGEVVFEQKDVEVPKFWSQNATNIVASKYFRGPLGTPQRESSVKQLISRVVKTITGWGVKDGDFDSEEEAEIFAAELTHLLVYQKAAFNSPVYFNIGVPGEKQQAAACFILSIEDTMESILDWYRTEGLIFKGGSGSGVNLSKLRSSKERLAAGGMASGPVSFMRGADAIAGTIKSGGKSRRAAKMIVLNVDHPDIVDFIWCKAKEEKKAYLLGEAGYDMSLNGEAWISIQYQNANNSVRVTDEFMRAVLEDKDWHLRAVTNGQVLETIKARDLMRQIAQAAWECADPGMQYDTTINDWHTVPNSGRINASNPCCVTGDTLIAVADGRNAVTIRELVGQEVPVYAWDHRAGKVIIGRMWNIGIKRRQVPVYRVTLDDGSSFRATDDHLIMLRDGSYRQVKDLKAGDSLNPFYSKIRQPSNWRTARRYVYTGQGWRAQYRWVWEAANGKQPEGYHIHHRDFDSLNDRLDNLELLLAEEHETLHRETMLGDNNPARRCMTDEWRARIAQAVHGEKNPHYDKPHTPETRAKMRVAAAWCWSNPEQHAQASASAQRWMAAARAAGRRLGREPGERYERCCPACRQNFVTAREEQIFCSYACRYSPLGLAMIGAKGGASRRGRSPSPEHRERLRLAAIAAARPEDKRRAAAQSLRSQCLKAARLLLDAGCKVRLKEWDALRETAHTLGARHVLYRGTLQRFFASDADLWEQASHYNHKVVSVEFDGVEDVYDGTVDGHHNFAIITSQTPSPVAPEALDYSGCFVHNSEYMSLDDTSCNLSSLNLMKFLDENGEFDVESFKYAVATMILAQEIIVGNASYPTEKIRQNTISFRQLGLGYANLGALLMVRGLPYDSDEGRALAGAITALMTGHAYATSALIAKKVGPFAGFEENREPMLRVMRKHRDALAKVDPELAPPDLYEVAKEAWDEAVRLGELYGYRNAQVSVIAPTGTIAFMLDCDTTGIEPDLALVKYKTLVGGGVMKIVNQTVPLALKRLGYAPDQIEAVVKYIDEKGTIEGAPHLKAEHLPVFDCAFRPPNGTRFIHYMGHVKMLAAVQPFISGSISKCVTADTLILTQHGVIPIGQFYDGEIEDSFRRLKVELASIDAPQMADLFYYGGVRPTIRLALADGRMIEGTPNHRVKVANQAGYGWKRLDQITTDDFVAIKLGSEVWAKQNFKIHFRPSGLYGSQKRTTIPEEMSPQLARFIGYYIAEGSMVRSNWTLRITNNSDAVLDHCLATTKELFGIDGRIEIDKRNGVKSFVVSSKTLIELFDYLRCQGDPAEKEIPHSILQSTRDVIREFVAGLWLDGYVRNDGMIAICLDSEKLIRQLQIVLNNFGIRARIIKKYNKEYDKYYTELGVHGNDAKRFAELFQLDEPLKVERLGMVLNQEKTTDAVWSDVVPCFRDQIQGAIRSKHETMKWRKVFDPRTKNLSWQTVRDVYYEYHLPELAEIVENNIHFEPVREISEGFAEVYDFQVPGNHTFIGNGIVNHNTVNLPHDVTPEDVAQVYIEGWKLGLKALAIYRDSSKKVQPLSAAKGEKERREEPRPIRKRLPDERQAVTHKFSVGGQEGYITIGLFEDGTPGEVFLTIAKEGSTVSGLMDVIATETSIALQYGVPLKDLVRKFINTRFEPAGITNNPQIRFATSIIDYVFRWLGLKFLPYEDQVELGLIPRGAAEEAQAPLPAQAGPQPSPPAAPPVEPRPSDGRVAAPQLDGPPCFECGAIMVRAGSCHACLNCGATRGCS